MEKILSKKNLKRFIDDLKKKHDVIGPTKSGGGTSTYAYTTFGYIHKIEDLELCYGSSMSTLKKFFFPDQQTLYKYKKTGDNVLIEDLHKSWDKEKVFIGLHACDIAAISCLDKVFQQDSFKDLHYIDRRKKSIIIGLTCSEAQTNCFCDIVGSGPDSNKGFDLLMTDLGDRFFFKTGSNKGKELISAEYFSDATKMDRQKRDEEIAKIRTALGEKIDLQKVTESMPRKYDDQLWHEFSEACYSCGACNMTCPTCHCFAITDKTSMDRSEGKRVLIWDSCHFERFALMGGNINVREERSSRYKHRLYDKFVYDLERYGTVFCVGCGRCQEFCPSHLDIRKALKRLSEE